jgi:hypothetical protein
VSVAWPTVKAGLLTLLPTLPAFAAVEVFNGRVITADVPADYVTVAWVPGEDFGGSFEQLDELGGLLTETGTVRSEIVCSSGDVDLPVVEARAFALFGAWQAAVRADGTLGVLPQGSAMTLACDAQPEQTDRGSVQRLVVTLTYTARLF